MNRIFLEEIMKLKSSNDFGLFSSLNILKKYVNVDLLMNEKNELYYSVNVNNILLSDISSDELINIRNSGWELSSDKKFLIKII